MNAYLNAIKQTADSYRSMIDGTVAQLSDDEFFRRPDDGINSVAVLLRHLGGNLQSRWTDFLTTDGEKPNRDRDLEFQDWEGDRESLLAFFDSGWRAMTNAIEPLDESALSTKIKIRGESHTIAQALTRSIAHIAYHVGQIALIARIVHQGEWKWLTIAPGESARHNERTWGTTARRSVCGSDGN